MLYEFSVSLNFKKQVMEHRSGVELSGTNSDSLFAFRLLLCAGLLFGSVMAFAQHPQGFFLDNFQARDAEIPVTFSEKEKPSQAATTTVNIDFSDALTPVSKYIFGNNANVYMTQMVDQTKLLNHIKTLSPNVLRFPGGNLSSVYLWNSEVGQLPTDAPAKLIDANGTQIDAGYWFGRNTASWSLSVQNYYAMLQAVNSTGIITVNYGYARYSTATNPVASAAHLAAEWVRYDNGRTKFWEVGNESNGSWQAGFRINTANNKDGQPQIITGALYGKHFKVFADSMRKAAAERDATIYIGAQLLQEAPASWWNETDRNWNQGVFQEAGNAPDYYIIHSYYTPFQVNSNAADILNSAHTVTADMMEYVTSSQANAAVPPKPVALTEWNIFAEGSKQQVSYINGMHAAIVLGELIKNKYGLACRWDLANAWNNGNDHGMFSQDDEPGVPRWNPRAPYYYMYYFQKYFGDHMIQSTVSGNQNVLAYASKYESGQAALVVVNTGITEQIVSINMNSFGYGERFYWHSLTGGTDNGEFSLKVFVNGAGPVFSSGGPADVKAVKPYSASIGSGVKFTAPPRSVQYVLIENGSNIITGNETAEEPAIKLFPNPAGNNLRIELPGTGFSSLTITDVRGTSVYAQQISSTETALDLKTMLPAGMYMVHVSKKEKIFRKKIVIR
jgi:hypothetical protein